MTDATGKQSASGVDWRKDIVDLVRRYLAEREFEDAIKGGDVHCIQIRIGGTRAMVAISIETADPHY